MDINKILKQAEELAVYANKVEKERDEAIAKLAAMEAELYALKGQAAGVWDSVPADKPAVAVLEVTDYMVYAFHHALTDADIGENDFNCLKKGLEAALLAAPSHSQQSANKAHLWDGKGVCTKCGTMIFGCLDRCPSHESEQQNDYHCHYCGSNVCE